MSGDFEQWKLVGEEMGLESENLLIFVLEECNKAREDRARDRSRERAAREHEISMAELELKKKDKDIDKLKLEKDSGPSVPAVGHEPQVRDISRPQPYRDGEDITSYVIRFEIIAEMLRWNRDNYAVQLGLLLQGEALKIYASLSLEITNDYELLKASLLQAFRRNEEQYRREFRHSKISTHENYGQFVISLSRMFDFWINSLKIERNYDSLRKAMIIDQFLASLSPELRIFVRERSVTDPQEMAKLADSFASARNCYPKDNVTGRQTSTFQSKSNLNNSKLHKGDGKQRSCDDSRTKCFSYGALGHRRSSCPQNQSSVARVHQAFNNPSPYGPMVSGSVNGSRVSSILRDTGCSCVIISEEVLPDIDLNAAPKPIFMIIWDEKIAFL